LKKETEILLPQRTQREDTKEHKGKTRTCSNAVLKPPLGGWGQFTTKEKQESYKALPRFLSIHLTVALFL
jgi:hypothetical protein